MPETVIQPEKKRWFRFFKRLTVWLVFLVVLAAAVAKTFFLPTYLQQQFQQGLGDYWDGSVQIRHVDLNLSGSLVLNDVTLLDRTQQRWLYIDEVRLIFADWPSLHPVLTTIEINDPDIQLYMVNGQYTLPFKTPADTTDDFDFDSYIDIRNINLRNCCLGTLNKNGIKKNWDNIQISTIKQGPSFNVLLNRLATDGSSNLVIGGTVDPNNYETRLSVELACQADKFQIKELLTTLDIPIIQQAEGKLMASLDITGRLDQPGKLQFNGIIHLNDWNLIGFHSLEVNNLNTIIKATGRRFHCQRITAESCQGTVQGSLYTNIDIDRPVQTGGTFSADKIDLDKLTEGITDLPRIEKGIANAHYTFTVQDTGLPSLNGYGLLFVDNARLWNLPVILQLFDHFKINHRDPLSASDVITLFSMKGDNIVFQQAVLANAISAIEMEPGGRVNMETQQIDMYVVGVPLKTLRKIISAVPLIKLFIPLRDRFSRLHLRGSWNDSTSALIFKEPFKKIEKDTQSVFTGVAKAEGQLNEDTIKLFKGMFEDLTRKKSTPVE